MGINSWFKGLTIMACTVTTLLQGT